MSEYIYGVYDPDSDVWTNRIEGKPAVRVSYERISSECEYPAQGDLQRIEYLKVLAKWYSKTKRFRHGLPDPGFLHTLDTIEQANALLEDLKTMGYWVPDRMFFKAS